MESNLHLGIVLLNSRSMFEECSLLVTLPLFELDVGEEEIVIEMCGYVKFKNIVFLRQCLIKRLWEVILILLSISIKN
ncbi:MAG: hypothetical protein E7Z81_07820 [Methanobrevibacter sp.]|uniref:hypothetical protein n=1 Tax=Methanobrevibacter sp. TaxID=66852 RepID=UPI0025CF12CD|nr:hypothetical protein [Methanobrevibacter sp.]MBE6498163.1 hypothetical protein [Methanobrevibacter sp.]